MPTYRNRKRPGNNSARDYNTRRRTEDPQYRLFLYSKHGAALRGLDHNIDPEDIPLPQTCKYLGIRLVYRVGHERDADSWTDDIATIDRIDSRFGYIKGNIQVISNLANRMKTNATLEQLLAFAQGVLRVHGSVSH